MVAGFFSTSLILHDRLDAFETVFPGQDHAHRRAILIGQRFAVHAEAEQGQGMHGFVQAESFNVGEFYSGMRPGSICSRIVIAFERHILCFGLRRHFLSNALKE